MAVRAIPAEEFEPEQAQGAPSASPTSTRTIKAEEFEPDQPSLNVSIPAPPPRSTQEAAVPSDLPLSPPPEPTSPYDTGHGIFTGARNLAIYNAETKKRAAPALGEAKLGEEGPLERYKNVEIPKLVNDQLLKLGLDPDLAAAISHHAAALVEPMAPIQMTGPQLHSLDIHKTMGAPGGHEADISNDPGSNYTVIKRRAGGIVSVLPRTVETRTGPVAPSTESPTGAAQSQVNKISGAPITSNPVYPPAQYAPQQTQSTSAQRTDPESGITTTNVGRVTQRVLPGAVGGATAPTLAAPPTTPSIPPPPKPSVPIPSKSTAPAPSQDQRGPVIKNAIDNPIDSDKTNLAAMGRDWAYLGIEPANPSLKVQTRQWMNRHDLQPGFKVPPAQQEQIRKAFVARNAAITLLDDIMIHRDSFKDTFDAGKIALSLSPTATGALASRLVGLTDAQARVASDWQQLEEHINTVRLALGAGGFRGEEAWNALQRLRGNPLADPRIILQNVEQTRGTLAELNNADKIVMQGRGTDLSTPAPETKTVNGVVYEKVTGGWRRKQ